MLDKKSRISTVLLASVLVALIESNTAFAKTKPAPDESIRQIDIVIALDVSGSMSGLIASAKQRLWDIVNQLGRAQP